MKRILTTVLAAVLLVATVFTLASCGGEKVKEEPENAGVMSISLCSSEGTTTYALADGPIYCVEKTITATVQPTYAINKEITWSVDWQTNNEGEDADISDYIKIAPSGDYNETLAVRCYKAFTDSTIAIKAETTDKTCSAVCIVTFEGIPSSLEVDTSEYSTAKNANKDMVVFISGQDNTLAINLDNLFGVVGENYDTFTVTMVGHGAVTVQYGAGSEIVETASMRGNKFVLVDTSGTYVTEIMSYSIVDGNLVITGLNMANSSSGFVKYNQDYMPYATITVTEISTKVSYTFDAIVLTAAQAIELSNGTLVF